MCRRYAVASRGAEDMLRLAQDGGAQVWAERLDRHELHAAAECALQERREGHERVEPLRAGRELDEQVHVAGRASLVARERAEEEQPLHTERGDRLTEVGDALDGVGP